MLGGRIAYLLIVTAAWAGCGRGELVGLHRSQLDLDHGLLTIDPFLGALHESGRRRWLGPLKPHLPPGASRRRHSSCPFHRSWSMKRVSDHRPEDRPTRDHPRPLRAAATAVTSNTAADCCGRAAVEIDDRFGAVLYSTADWDQLPVEAAASLGCGNPPP